MENCVLWVGLPGGIWFGLGCGAHWGYQWGLRLLTAAAAGFTGLAAARAWRADPREPQTPPGGQGSGSRAVQARSRPRRQAAARYCIWVRGSEGATDRLIGARDTHAAAQELQRRTAAELSRAGRPSCVFVRREA